MHPGDLGVYMWAVILVYCVESGSPFLCASVSSSVKWIKTMTFSLCVILLKSSGDRCTAPAWLWGVRHLASRLRSSIPPADTWWLAGTCASSLSHLGAWFSLGECSKKGAGHWVAGWLMRCGAQCLGPAIFIKPQQLCQAIRVLTTGPSAA